MLDQIPDKKEQFKGAHVIGWNIAIIALAFFAGAVILGAWNGIKHDFGFGKFFGRFLFMLYGMEERDRHGKIVWK